MGGTLNPFFGFLSLMTLLLTLSIQSKQLQISSQELKLSRFELELTREELKKSALAQHESQKALNKQAEIANNAAKLSTISFLLEKYSKDYKMYGNIPHNGPGFMEKTAILGKINELNNIAEVIFNDLKKLGETDNE